ncbi:unnamed protein product [Lactuca saligna]|uniref:Uncharacterized protein n=1 Tax=Lactuca saligna TaxID=75948 RepID=A0AA35YKH3_LACSI|nr:unnamed protein product [Lactuca saligna]
MTTSGSVVSRRAVEEDEYFKTLNFRAVLSSIHPMEEKADVAQQLKKRKNDQVSVPLENVTVETKNDSDSGDQQQTNIPKNTLVKSSMVSNTASSQEEVGTPDITMNLFNEESNVNMDEEMINNESTITSFIVTSTILPPLTSPIPTYVPISTISPTFFGVM